MKQGSENPLSQALLDASLMPGSCVEHVPPTIELTTRLIQQRKALTAILRNLKAEELNELNGLLQDESAESAISKFAETAQQSPQKLLDDWIQHPFLPSLTRTNFRESGLLDHVPVRVAKVMGLHLRLFSEDFPGGLLLQPEESEGGAIQDRPEIKLIHWNSRAHYESCQPLPPVVAPGNNAVDVLTVAPVVTDMGSMDQPLIDMAAPVPMPMAAAEVAPMPTAAPVAGTAPFPAEAMPIMTGSGQPRLELVQGGAMIPLPDKDDILVGREDPLSEPPIFPDVDMTPYGGEEGGVSRRHARIIRREGDYLIEDLQSTNYSKLNGARLSPRTPSLLVDGSRIDFGKIGVIFRR